VIRHRKESLKASNSARIADICLRKSAIVDHPFPENYRLDLNPEQDLLVFVPATEGKSPPIPAQPKRLIFLDGSWKQTRRMFRRIPGLDSLGCVQLRPSLTPPPRVRAPPFPGGMSTMESIAAALAEMECPQKARTLEKALSIWMEQVWKSAGIRMPPSPGKSIRDARNEENGNV
jgi:DTW domain-containing protein